MTRFMCRLFFRLLALLAGLVLSAAACGVSRDSGGGAVATLSFGDGSSVEITGGQVDEIVGELRAAPSFTEAIGLPEDQFELLAIDQLVRTEIAEQVLASNGGQVTADQVDTARAGLEGQLLNIFSGVPEIADPEAETAEVSAQMDGYLTSFSRSIAAAEQLPDLVAGDLPEVELPCARHILLATLEEAEDVVSEIEGGADFAEMAMERSTGPSGPNGGELGCASPDGYVPEFRDALLAAEVGQLVGPVETQFGFHVIEVTAVETQPGDSSSAVDAAFLEVYQGLTVEIDEDLGRWDAAARQVVLPERP